jgi:putative transposase
LTEAAARGEHDLFYLDQCGFAPAMPLRYTWAREGTRPLARYEAPQGRRVNVLGALAPFGPQPRFVYESRLASEGKLDSAVLLDFVCRDIVGLRGGYATLNRLADDPTALAATRRAVAATIALDNYGVHHSKVVKAALPTLAALGVSFYYLPPYSPKLNRIEPEWHALKYHRLADCSFTSGLSLKAAVDATLDGRATELTAAHSTNHLLEAA